MKNWRQGASWCMKFVKLSYPLNSMQRLNRSNWRAFSQQEDGKKKKPFSLVNAIPSQAGKVVTLETATGEKHHYPILWLRDNCQCPLCFNAQMQSRTIDWRYFDLNVCTSCVSVEDDDINIIWSDGHKSRYKLNWLLERSFAPERQRKWLSQHYPMPRIAWGSTMWHKVFKKYNYEQVYDQTEVLLDWLESLSLYGVALLTNAPQREDVLRQLVNKVAFIKRTHYGEEFLVKHQPETQNIAYTSGNLQIHTDLPYYDYKPGVNLLHCLVQTEGPGGENQVTDGLWVAEKLRREKPEIYKLLTEIPVDWNDIVKEGERQYINLYRSPVILNDSDGNFLRIDYSHQQRDSHFSVPLDKVIPWYKAQAVFTDELYHPDNTVYFKLNPGEILTFDNLRLLHGRKGYKDHPGNQRWLIGAYMDWDHIYSRIRVLRRELQSSPFSSNDL